MQNFQKIDFTSNTKYEELNINFEVDEIYIDKSTIGKDEKEKFNFNFLAVGRTNDEAKKLIASLSNNRYFLTAHSNGISLFKKFTNADDFLPNFNNKAVKTWNDTFYILEEPIEKEQSGSRLLVIFSSIADLAFNASIDRRMFFKNFPDIANYIPQNTYILRIADLGGVLGSFYLNSNADIKFEEKIKDLILKIQLEYSISNEHTVLYGASKGATGAVYYGINMGLKALAINPIISDEYYINKFNDLHFVSNVFPESKKEKFIKLFSENSSKDLTNIKIITSPRLVDFPSLRDFLLIPQLKICTYIFNNPKIKSDKDIELHNMNFIIAMLNNMLYGIDTKNSLTTTY
ncbi:XcbB/CpsF family capsular polysaccharide biosynthesis protein [Bibersteinia trehalosi]|nr:XcbB/CpsF family capsular polysaccharide biosynthesis protein [Bibersteinia trehalosi]